MRIRLSSRVAAIAALASSTMLVACDRDGPSAPTADEIAQLSSMLLDASALPASPTNRFADDPAAVALGRRLFFDERMSADGKVACANCHDPKRGFSDPKPVSAGVAHRVGARHSMPATALPFHPFLFWDGRADSMWSQPLKAIEGSKEMDFSRVEVAHFIAKTYAADYQAIFGDLPDLGSLPARAEPGMPAWESLTAAQRDDVQRVFANVGKALEAYERKLTCANTRFDRWMREEINLSTAEAQGAASFVRDGCPRCHDGPSFSDGKFHDLGLAGAEDPGRSAALKLLLADPFNGAGIYSDDPVAGQTKLSAVALEGNTQGAFRTASLRGAGQRDLLGHLGNRSSLADFIDKTYDRGGRGDRRGDGRDPLLDGVEPDNLDELVAFLHTLDCPAVTADLLAP